MGVVPTGAPFVLVLVCVLTAVANTSCTRASWSLFVSPSVEARLWRRPASTTVAASSRPRAIRLPSFASRASRRASSRKDSALMRRELV